MGTERERETLLRAAPFLLPAHLPLPDLFLRCCSGGLACYNGWTRDGCKCVWRDDLRDMHQETTVLGQGIISNQDIDLGSYQKPVSVGSTRVLYEDPGGQAPPGRPWSTKVI